MQLSDGTELCQVAFPRLLGDVRMILVTYEGEAFPSTLRHHPKMEIDLQPPAEDHWNVALDRVLPTTMDAFWHKWEAKVPSSAHGEASHPGEAARGAPGGTSKSQDGGLLPTGSRS